MTQFGKEGLTVNPLEGLLCVRCYSSRRDRHGSSGSECRHGVTEDICQQSKHWWLQTLWTPKEKEKTKPCHQVIHIRLKRQMCSNKLHLVYVKGWTSYKYRRPWRGSEDQIAKRPRTGGISLTDWWTSTWALKKGSIKLLRLEKSFWQTAPRIKAERDFQGVPEKVNNFPIPKLHTQILTHFNFYFSWKYEL